MYIGYNISSEGAQVHSVCSDRMYNVEQEKASTAGSKHKLKFFVLSFFLNQWWWKVSDMFLLYSIDVLF